MSKRCATARLPRAQDALGLWRRLEARVLLGLGLLLVARFSAPAHAERPDRDAPAGRPESALDAARNVGRISVADFARDDDERRADDQPVEDVLRRACIVPRLDVSEFARSAGEFGSEGEPRALRSDDVPRSWRMDVSEFVDDGGLALGETLQLVAERGPLARRLSLSEFQHTARGDSDDSERGALSDPKPPRARLHVSEF